MTKIAIPEYFKDRPYTIEHFSKIVAWASTQHPFYQKHIPNPKKEVPILQRQTIQDDNDLLINGHEETGRTSGSTGMPRPVWRHWFPSPGSTSRDSMAFLPLITDGTQQHLLQHHHLGAAGLRNPYRRYH